MIVQTHEFCERLKTAMNRLGIRQAELIERANRHGEEYGVKFGKSDISQYLSGRNKPRSDKLKVLADVLNVQEYWLMGLGEVNSIRILGSIHCGEPVWADESYDEFLTTTVRCDFALRAVGDSMNRAGINDGDMVLVRSQDTAENNQIAVVLIGDSTTLKRVEKRGDRVISFRPESSNPTHEPIYLDEQDEQVRILGIAVAVQHAL